ncbi:MAG: hypothetical protein CFE37_04220 [Alphaproteobacteria bacterium PA4]|nr:MAG: hypothetical protein CFE37_04220 [Alphaproteobacteria bacterium PA4]
MGSGLLKATVRLALASAALLVMTPVMAQTASPQDLTMGTNLSEADLQIMRADLRADKRKVTAETLDLTEAEAARFWPVYDRYIAELTVINNAKYALIKEYSEHFGSYNDAEATRFISRWLDVDVKADTLRKKYVPIVGKVLPGIKAASFFQIDRRLAMLINLGLSSQLPILQLQGAK